MSTIYDLTDAEGSVLTSLSSSAVLGEQIYGPYGNQRYSQGTMGTDKGYTGQFQDAVSGFDYYNARYYDPVMGQFLSADHVQGNAQGMDPYSYVNGNPETATDPTGQRISCPPDCGTTTGSSGGSAPCTLGHAGCGSPALTSCDSGFHLTNGSCEQNAKKTGSGGGNGGGNGGCKSKCGGSGLTTQVNGDSNDQTTKKQACTADCVQKEVQIATDADNQLGGIIKMLQGWQFWFSRIINWLFGFLGTAAGMILGVALAGPLGLAFGAVGPFLYAAFTDAASNIGDLITDAQNVQSQFKSEEAVGFWAGSAAELNQKLEVAGTNIGNNISNYTQEFTVLEKVGMALTLVGPPVAPIGGAVYGNAAGAEAENQQISNISYNASLQESLNCNCIGGV